jgi:S-adenosylmethionine:tRNA ribosyltransferase-isomerase
MELKEFTYELPQSLIAPYPSEDRTKARLMVIERNTGKISHSEFASLGNFLVSGDLLVINDSKVLPVRLRGKKESGGRVEVLLLEAFPEGSDCWIALVEAAKRPRVGNRFFFPEGVNAEVMGVMGRGRYGLRFHHQGSFMEMLSKVGEPPLPPYIMRNRDAASLDRERYQTVYASCPGSIAAPTAGFHFTEDLLEEMKKRGVDNAVLTLHVGPATFRPIRVETVERHRMEGERYNLGESAATEIDRAKSGGRRVIAVGSTATRTLEGIAQRKGRVEADHGITRLFIRPGYAFRVINGLITNFHLPGSTPLILVAAFTGLDLVRRAYREAVRLRYRFYSYGDAMLIL